MRRSISRFRRDEAGAITPLMLVLFIGMLLVTGISMDLLKHEAERADLQAALDRGVQAAALSRSMDPQSVIADHVRKGLQPGTRASVSVARSRSANGPRIEASATHGMETAFLRMIGMHELHVVASATAVLDRGAPGISPVADLPGSAAGREREPRLAAAYGVSHLAMTGQPDSLRQCTQTPAAEVPAFGPTDLAGALARVGAPDPVN